MPAFWILDVATPDGRDGLYGLATTTRAGWWASDFGRMYSGRGVTWGMEEMSGDAPVSLAYRHDPRAWFVLGARGTLLRLGDDAAEATLPVTAPLRRLRPAGDELVAVGAGGQIFRGRDWGWLIELPSMECSQFRCQPHNRQRRGPCERFNHRREA